MSQEGWRAFRNARLPDWVVLHGGATAAYRMASLSEGATLAAALAAVPRLGRAAVLTLTAEHLTVRLGGGVLGLETQHVEVARAVSAAAREHGAEVDRAAIQEVQVAVAARPDEINLGFWRAVLGYAPMDDDNGVDPLGHGSTVWMQDLDPARPLRHAMHLDVSVAHEHVRERVAAAVAAGGRIVEESRAPGYWILADSAGNKVCVCAWPDGADDH